MKQFTTAFGKSGGFLFVVASWIGSLAATGALVAVGAAIAAGWRVEVAIALGVGVGVALAVMVVVAVTGD